MNRRLLVASAVAVLCLTGCWEMFSWSPDGRYLAFVGPDDQRPWRWDSRTGLASRMPAPPGEIAQVKYLSSAGEYLLLHESEGSGEAAIQIRGLPGGPSVWDLGVETYAAGFAVSPDLAHLYVVHERDTEDGQLYELKEFDMARREEARILFSTKLELYWLAVSPSGDRLLFSLDEDSIQMLALDDASPQPRAVTRSDAGQAMPVWVDNDRFVYHRGHEHGNNEFLELVLYSLKDGSERILHDFALATAYPSISPDGKRVLISALIEKPEDFDDIDPLLSGVQLVEVDIASGAAKVLTDEPLGAGYGAYNPVSNSVAYYSPPDLEENSTARVLNLDTHKLDIIWRDEEERLIAMGDRQAKDGRNAMALATYRDLLARFPDTRFMDLASYAMAALHLEPPFLDLDQAHAHIKRISNESIQQNALPLFWRAEDVVASDPRDDLAQRYSAEEQEAFDFEPNPAMDLRGLSARWSDSRLYLKIDFAGPHDMRLMEAKDLLFLFSRADAAQDSLPLVSHLVWDYPVHRLALLRHWAPGQRCDAEFRDAEGRIVSSFASVGSHESSYSALDVVSSYTAESDSSLVVSLSRYNDGLNLRGGEDIYIQVCTLKPSQDGAQPEGFADAFGAGNTAEAGDPNVVRGYAAVLIPGSGLE